METTKLSSHPVHTMGHYNPANSTVSTEQMNHFLTAPFTASLEDIPGIGKATHQQLMHPSDNPEFGPILNNFQLFGKFLSLKGPGVDSVAHCELFYQWLLGKGVVHNTSNIVHAVANRMNAMLPGIYDASMYGSTTGGWHEAPHHHTIPSGSVEVHVRPV